MQNRYFFTAATIGYEPSTYTRTVKDERWKKKMRKVFTLRKSLYGLR